MNLKIKSIYFISFVFLLGISTIFSIDETTRSTVLVDETTENYADKSDLKCLNEFEYNVLIELFINETAKEIQSNHLSEAMERLNKVSPNDDRLVHEIVMETLKQPHVKLLYLLEFINQTKLATTKLNGLIEIFTFMNNTKFLSDPYSKGPSFHTIYNWLDLMYFTRYFADRLAAHNNSEISTRMETIWVDVQGVTENVVLNKSNQSLFTNDDFFDRKKVKFGSEHIFFIVKSYYNNRNSSTGDFIQSLELLYRHGDKTMCWSFVALYDLLESSLNPNETFKLLPTLKYLSGSERGYRGGNVCNEILKSKFKNGSIFQQILSENYFRLKNVYNNQFLYVKQKKRVELKKGKSNFVIKTVSDSDTDKVNWKFSANKNFRTDRILLTIRNENFQKNNLRALPCLIHDEEAIIQMEAHSYRSVMMSDDVWNIEVDDMAGDRFRLRNDFTNGYLAVSMDTVNNQNNVILVKELKPENYDSVHWTLEKILEE